MNVLSGKYMERNLAKKKNKSEDFQLRATGTSPISWPGHIASRSLFLLFLIIEVKCIRKIGELFILEAL